MLLTGLVRKDFVLERFEKAKGREFALKDSPRMCPNSWVMLCEKACDKWVRITVGYLIHLCFQRLRESEVCVGLLTMFAMYLINDSLVCSFSSHELVSFAFCDLSVVC